LLRAPTFSEIDMSLSFRTTITFAPDCLTLLSASKAMPAVIAPSPMTAIARWSRPSDLAATAMPSAAEIDVDECAVPKVS
jgi:negative regulator of replication initiation